MDLLVPQPKLQRLQAHQESNRFYFLENGIFVIAFCQVVIWDSGIHMMDVVEPDIPGEPLQ